MSDFERLRAEHEAAQKRLRALEEGPEAKAVRLAASKAANEFYRAERVEYGRQIVARVVGQTVVAIRPRYHNLNSDVLAEYDRLEVGLVLVLGNGVEIEAASRSEDWSEAQLEVSEARVEPPSVSAVDPSATDPGKLTTRD